MTAQALIIGGGSENGIPILETLIDNHFKIINFGSSIYQHSDVTNIRLDWDQVNIEFIQKNFSKFTGVFDFVFFNQNGSSLNINNFGVNHDDILTQWRYVLDWGHSHWVSCQMPFLILHTIRKNLNARSKIGWMLSTYINREASGNVDFPDYSANKYFNYLSMKAFGSTNEFKTFGILPNFSANHGKTRLKQIVNDIVNDRTNGTDLFAF